MFELFMFVYSYCNALSARFFAVDRALNSYFMIMIKLRIAMHRFRYAMLRIILIYVQCYTAGVFRTLQTLIRYNSAVPLPI